MQYHITLIPTDLPVTMRFFHSTCGRRTFASCFRGQLLTGSLSTSGFTCRLLCTCHLSTFMKRKMLHYEITLRQSVISIYQKLKLEPQIITCTIPYQMNYSKSIPYTTISSIVTYMECVLGNKKWRHTIVLPRLPTPTHFLA